MRVNIHPPSEVIYQQFQPFLFRGLEYTPTRDKDRISYISSWRNLRLKIIADNLFISGSLCKAYHGYNHVNFTFTQLQELKQELEEVLEVPASQIQVTRAEYGLVCDVTNSGISFSNLGKYKLYFPEKMRDYSGKVYGGDYVNSTHRVKFYDKTYEARRNQIYLDRKIIRIEKVVSLSDLRRVKAFNSLPLRTLEDVCSQKVQETLFKDLISTISRIEFLDLDRMGSLSARELRVYSYMNNEIIRKVVSKNFKAAYNNDKRVYQKCLQKLESKTFQKFLKELYKLNESLFPSMLLEGKKGTVKEYKNY